MKTNFTLTKPNLVFSAICLGGLTLIVLACILPLLAEKHELTNKIPELNGRLKNQADMVTVLTVIDKKLAELEKLEILPEVQHSSITITNSHKVISDITERANKLNLEDVDIAAIMPKSSINLQEMYFTTSVKGEIKGLRSYIYSLLQIPYINKITQLEIISDDGVLILEMTFTVRIS